MTRGEKIITIFENIEKLKASKQEVQAVKKIADRANEKVEALDSLLGDIETALDGIIAIQNEFMGVSE